MTRNPSHPPVMMPQAIDKVRQVFPASVSDLMPPYDEIPEEFKYFRSNDKWQRFASTWFFEGVHDLKITPKPGIDKDLAVRHLATIQGSFEPKHEHKEAAVAYLASEWFKDVKYKVGRPQDPGQKRSRA